MLLLRRINSALQHLRTSCSKRGPYRFLVRDWGGISDINVAIKTLGTEFFRNEMQPVPLPIKRLKSILVISPHQDDETIGAGGTLLLAKEAGVKIDILYVTDGVQMGRYNPEESARVRDQEAQEVCARLGATIHRLGISNYRPEPDERDLKNLSSIANQIRPQVVMIPWILDRPTRHRIANHLLWLANHCNGLPDFEVWGYQVHNTLYPNGYIDITEVADEKREMLECYKSQNMFIRYDHLAMGMSAWNLRFLPGSMQSDARYVEVFFALPVKEHLRLVESFYFKDLRAIYRDNSAVLSGMMALHRAVVGDI